MEFIRNNHVFKGHRTFLGAKFVTYGELELPLRYEIFSECNSGFDWGNSSSGSRQLAFSILFQLSDEEFARENYIEFTADTVQELNYKDWILVASDVVRWMSNHKKVAEKVLDNSKTDEKNSRMPININLRTLIPRDTIPKKRDETSKKKCNVVKKACDELKITQKELASILEIPEGTVSSWAVKNEIPRLGKKAIEFYAQNQKTKEIIDSYKSFTKLLNVS
ncbi:DUF6166 domain-containing protein [Sulfurimonas sp.]|uniref:DUF6166 domain-containing protein n=1 Tax=Sulfurimonas sp. TaxID=2022749 RepID=UPI0025D657B5|nr:DUF6166 domain-containing protein [Sulfurimonas sp.]MDD5156934.1 DUF6166 domain-containing protein [Sulfurimonas sp.]